MTRNAATPVPEDLDDEPRALPDDLGDPGRAWLERVGLDYALSDTEHEIALCAARTLDRCALLDAVLTDDGIMADSSQGIRAHPAAVELRQQEAGFARLVAALRLPDLDPAARLQRRTAFRAPGGPRVAAPGPRSVSTMRVARG